MPSLSITERDVEALVDSHLDWEEEKRVRESLRSNPALLAYYERIVTQKKLLVAWWNSEEEKRGRAACFH